MPKLIFIIFFVLSFSFLGSCGANMLEFMEGSHPDDELSRILRESNEDPKQELLNAKEALKKLGNADLVKALDDMEAKMESGTEYKDLTDEDFDSIRKNIDKSVIDAIKSGDYEDGSEVEETIVALGRVAQAYEQTTAYDQVDFVSILASSSDGSSKAALTEGVCGTGMEYFLKVAANIRKKYCDESGLAALDRLEVSHLIRTAMFTDPVDGGGYEFSEEIEEFREEAEEDLAELMSDETFSGYILSLFFQVTYVSCEFINDDCEVNSDNVTLNGLKRIWDSFQLADALEEDLKKSNLLPDISFSAGGIIDDIREQASEIDDCEYEDKVYCALENHFNDTGTSCNDGSHFEAGDCAAGG